jgi:hypothetical protein
VVNIIFLSTLIISIFLIAGVPITAMTFSNRTNKVRIEVPLFVAISLIIGFGIWIFSASLAYSFFGINTFFVILFVIIAILWFLLLVKFKKKIYVPQNNNGFVYTLFAFFALSVYFAKSQWNSTFKPIIHSGVGPDVSQNLLAGFNSQNIGNTWLEASRNLMNMLNANNLNQAAFDFFRQPSIVDTASYDYLVYGGRWGLTIPYGQIIRLFGPQAVMWEIGTILFVTIFSSLIVVFGVTRILVKSNFSSFLISIAVVINGGLINQYFNGGLSQAFGSIANVGILLVLMLILTTEQYLESKSQKTGVILLATMAWVASALTYIESTIVIVILLSILVVILLFKNRQFAVKICKYLFIPGILALTIMPVFVYSILASLTYRIDANAGTGVNTGVWKLPTQNLGFFSTYSTFSEPESAFLAFLSVLIMMLLVFVMVITFRSKNVLIKSSGSILLASLSTIFIGFLLGYFSRDKSSYIYNKISTYVAPFLIFALLISIYILWEKLKSLITIGVIATITIGSAFYVENQFSTSRDYATIMPTEYSKLLNDDELRDYFEQKNYILPYKPAYNYLALFGAKYWISRAPNDFDLNIDSRMNKELALLCFVGENICNPKTTKISNQYSPALAKYGIVEYESTLSTLEYSQLTIKERFDYAFDVMGTVKAIIPDKYMGGNPYLQ